MRALRAVLIALLVLVASGTAPAVATTLLAQGTATCEGTCPRCTCKRPPAVEHVRGPCPCCQPPHHAQVLTLLPPAVLPARSPAILAPPVGRTPACASDAAKPVSPAVAEPPPKARLLS